VSGEPRGEGQSETTLDVEKFHVYDTTLRDGVQQEGLSLSVHDKLAIAGHLDELGVGFIEGGWPGAVPKDTEFFRRARTELDLSTATLVAFGATRKADGRAADDELVRALVDAETPAVTLVAKSHVGHVERAAALFAFQPLSRQVVFHAISSPAMGAPGRHAHNRRLRGIREPLPPPSSRCGTPKVRQVSTFWPRRRALSMASRPSMYVSIAGAEADPFLFRTALRRAVRTILYGAARNSSRNPLSLPE
jgi:hypothetical protein